MDNLICDCLLRFSIYCHFKKFDFYDAFPGMFQSFLILDVVVAGPADLFKSWFGQNLFKKHIFYEYPILHNLGHGNSNS